MRESGEAGVRREQGERERPREDVREAARGRERGRERPRIQRPPRAAARGPPREYVAASRHRQFAVTAHAVELSIH
eukprot:7384246-Prymnesium_polylepis.1